MPILDIAPTSDQKLDPERHRSRWSGEARLFLLLFFLLGALKIALTLATSSVGVDGGYFTDVARQVRDGLGLKSNVSVYHKGYTYFPHPTSVYPLWPWLLGMAGRVIDLELARKWLPTLFYLLSLVAAYGVGRSLGPKPLVPHLPSFHAGHLLLLMLGLQTNYFLYTSKPYTEGLAYFLSMCFFWRAFALWRFSSILSGLELGLWLVLLLLVRSQFLVFVIASSCTFLVILVFQEHRRRTLFHAIIAHGVLTCYALLHLKFLRSFLHDATLLSLFRFDGNQASELLQPIRVMVKTHGLWDFIADRSRGLPIAFSPWNKYSYKKGFHTFHYALLCALPLLLVVARDFIKGSGLKEIIDKFRPPLKRPDLRIWFFFGIAAFGGLLSVHVIHKVYYGAWYFHRRHALVALMAFFLPLLALLRSRRGWAVILGAALLISGVSTGFVVLTQRTARAVAKAQIGPKQRFPKLVDWLNRSALEHGGRVRVALMAQEPQRLVAATRGVEYHWFYSKTSYSDLLKIFDVLEAQYLIFKPERARRWHSVGSFRRLNLDFRVVDGQPDGFIIFERRPAKESGRIELLEGPFRAAGSRGSEHDEPD